MDSDYLKNLIYNHKHFEAREYLENSIEDLLCTHLESHTKNAFVSVSDVPESVAGSLMTYQLLQESKSIMPDEMAVMRLMNCYSRMKRGFDISNR